MLFYEGESSFDLFLILDGEASIFVSCCWSRSTPRALFSKQGRFCQKAPTAGATCFVQVTVYKKSPSAEEQEQATSMVTECGASSKYEQQFLKHQHCAAARGYRRLDGRSMLLHGLAGHAVILASKESFLVVVF